MSGQTRNRGALQDSKYISILSKTRMHKTAWQAKEETSARHLTSYTAMLGECFARYNSVHRLETERDSLETTRTVEKVCSYGVGTREWE